MQPRISVAGEKLLLELALEELGEEVRDLDRLVETTEMVVDVCSQNPDTLADIVTEIRYFARAAHIFSPHAYRTTFGQEAVVGIRNEMQFTGVLFRTLQRILKDKRDEFEPYIIYD